MRILQVKRLYRRHQTLILALFAFFAFIYAAIVIFEVDYRLLSGFLLDAMGGLLLIILTALGVFSVRQLIRRWRKP